MKAGRYYGPGDIRVENIPDPVPKEGQVKVKVISIPEFLDDNRLINVIRCWL
jgi:NADPH:quinone reductase-like Zn-dependent oxidoreductase